MGFYLTEPLDTATETTAAHRPRPGAKTPIGAPFSNPILSTKYWDLDTKTYAYQLRDYGPSIARWLSRDPIGRIKPNPYTGLLNTPLACVDSDGRDESYWPDGGNAPPWPLPPPRPAPNPPLPPPKPLPPFTEDCKCPKGSNIGLHQKKDWVPENDPTIDACTVPDSVMRAKGWYSKDEPIKGCSFKSACISHDICYRTCNSGKNNCDLALFNAAVEACIKCAADQGNADPNIFQKCTDIAQEYRMGVGFGGGDPYAEGQGKACEKCCCSEKQ